MFSKASLFSLFQQALLSVAGNFSSTGIDVPGSFVQQATKQSPAVSYELGTFPRDTEMQLVWILNIGGPVLAIGSLIRSRYYKAHGDAIKSKEAFIQFAGTLVILGLYGLGYLFLNTRLPWSAFVRLGILAAMLPFVHFIISAVLKRSWPGKPDRKSVV